MWNPSQTEAVVLLYLSSKQQKHFKTKILNVIVNFFYSNIQGFSEILCLSKILIEVLIKQLSSILKTE